MKQRALRLAGTVGCLLSLPFPLHAQADLSGIWTATGGEARFELRADLLSDFGIEVLDDGLLVHEVVETRRQLGTDDHLALEAPYGNFERFLPGRLTLDTGWLLRRRDREVRLNGLTLTPAIYRNGHPSLEVRDQAGRHLLTLTHLHILAEHERSLLTVHNADIVATSTLGERLGVEALADLPIGRAWLDLGLQVPAGADTSGMGPGCEDRPLWPQEGEQVDVGLIGMETVAYQGTDPVTGGVKVAPSATLKNLSQGDVPWIPKFTSLGPPNEYPYDPSDQHPFLVWNMYRIVDGRIEQLAVSGVKHAFLTLNQNCDINCGSGNVLWPGCEDVYSSSTNDNGSSLGPRDEIEASEGLFFSTCSFFDPGCAGTQTNSSGTFENRLLVNPDDLQTPDAEYFFDSWYVIQYDTDIWNSMGYHPITPTPAGDGWTFNPGPFTVGRALDEWVSSETPGPGAEHVSVVVPSATPDEPYPDNMPQGHIDVAVRVSEPEPGRFRYNYAVQNFDFDRDVEAFRIPIPPGAQVFDTRFGDVDDDAGNDWTVTVGSAFVSFEATADHPLPWFTLFNFEIEVDVPPAASQVTLDLGGDAVFPSIDVAVLGPPVVPTPQFEPTGLEVDESEIVSDANGVLEPGETVEVAPVWENVGTGAGELTGTAENLTGPPGATYTLSHENVDYGTVAPGATGSCQDFGGCYEVHVNAPPVRPATLWEATFDETISDGSEKTWTLHIGESFSDVPPSNPFYSAIENLLHNGITGGCADGAEAAGLRPGRGPDLTVRTDGRHGGRPLQAGGAAYCPGGANSRAQMPVLVLRALEGDDHTPLPCIEGDEPFDDVPFDSPFCPWIRDLANRGIVSGCGDRDYCPGNAVTRAQMSIFLLKTLEGDGYEPPECTNRFTDVPCPSLFADWIEDLAARGITGGCTATEYCPHDAVTRAQMAVFVTRTFGLELYGP